MRPVTLAAIGSFFAFLITGAFMNSMPLLAIAILLGAAAFAPLLGQREAPLGKAAWVVVISVFLAYPMVLYNSNLQDGYFHGGMVIASFGIAHAFVRSRLHSLVASTLAALMVYYIASTWITADPGAAFIGSPNRVSTLFLGLTVFMFVLGKRRYDLPVAAVVFLVAASAEGSTGIIAAAVLLSAVFLRDGREVVAGRGPTKFAITLMGLVAIGSIAAIAPQLFEGETRDGLDYQRLTSGDGRYQIIDWYAHENLTGTNLFLGSPSAYAIPVQSSEGEWFYLNNLHNSYLDLHSKTGIFGFVIVGALALRVFFLLRKDPFLAALMMVLLVRAFADTSFILQGRYNFALYVFLLPLGMLMGAFAENAEEVQSSPQIASLPASTIRAL